MRLLVVIPVAVEKLACQKSTQIRTRQEALQTIFLDHLDIFYPRILTCFKKKGVFQQPHLFLTVTLASAIGGQGMIFRVKLRKDPSED
jgi:hypothetical protein